MTRRRREPSPNDRAKENRRRRAEHEHLNDRELLRAANEAAARQQRNLEKQRRAERTIAELSRKYGRATFPGLDRHV